MKITNRIPFTLEEYKSGKYKVVTRDGKSVRIICTDFNNGRQSIVALISLRNGEESCTIFNTDGKYLNNGETSDYDLFLKETVFEDGDIISFGKNNNNNVSAIGIFKKLAKSSHEDYVVFGPKELSYDEGGWLLDNMCLATEEEKQRLFDALKKDGKRWNADKKCIEDIKKEYKFKPFDRVLVRDGDNDFWYVNLFGYFQKGYEYPYRGVVGCAYKQCIPFEGNEYLLGTTNSPKQ